MTRANFMVLILFLTTAILIAFEPPPARAGASGNYANSCDNCTDSGDKLSCSCKKRNGQHNSTSLWYGPCQSGSISNDNGVLKCPLRGTAWRTCRNTTWQGARISSECRKIDGTWVWTSINHPNCPGNFTNCDGALQCSDTCP